MIKEYRIVEKNKWLMNGKLSPIYVVQQKVTFNINVRNAFFESTFRINSLYKDIKEFSDLNEAQELRAKLEDGMMITREIDYARFIK